MKEVRPTSGQVLLALFNILDSTFGSVEGLRFLDLFAGTGRVGLEALKRGASSVIWVESVRSRAQAIERSVPSASPGDTTVLGLELRRAITWLLKREQVLDVVFADPPYHEGWGTALLAVKGLSGLLNPGGLLVVEHSSREPLSVSPQWRMADVRKYGETTLTFLSSVRDAPATPQEGEKKS